MDASTHRQRVCWTWAVLGLVSTLVLVPAHASHSRYVHLRLAGVVNPLKVRQLKQALERAQRERASFVLLSLDTPGGLVSSMQEIITQITNAPLPVIGLVEPASAQATSAGALILLACDVAAMLPDTRVGAAHPVGAGQALEGAVEQKATNSLASLARSLAHRRRRPEQLAEGMVRESMSYTAQEALDKHVVEFIVNNRRELLAQLEGHRLDFTDRRLTLATRDATPIEVMPSWSNRLLDALADPTIASLLLSIGVIGIIYELAAPGIGLGGVVGVTALLLGLLAMSVLPIQLVGFLLLGTGFLALALELLVPTHGLLGLGGLVALAVAALVLIDEASYFGGVQRIRAGLFLPTLVGLVIGLLALARVARTALRAPFQLGPSSLVGKSGTSKSDFVQRGEEFAGNVFVEGARWQAIADTQIARDAAIEVEEVLLHPTRLKVKTRGTP